MHPRDEEKMAFITELTNCCYQVMSFGQKIVGAMYQCLMDKIFKDKIRRNIEVYVDEIVVKSNGVKSHVEDLAEIISQIQKHTYNLTSKNVFLGLEEENFLVLCFPKEAYKLI